MLRNNRHFAWFAVILAVLLPVTGRAFTSCPNIVASTLVILPTECVTGHYNITFGGASKFGFSWSALTRVADANIGVDSKETHLDKPLSAVSRKLIFFDTVDYNPTHHFDHPPGLVGQNGLTSDQQAFVNARNYLLQQKDLVLANMGLGKCDQTGAALDALGRALHAIQDVYSHSNYVDGGYPAALEGLTRDAQVKLNAALSDSRIQPPVTLQLTLYGPGTAVPENPTGYCNGKYATDYCHEFWAKDSPDKNPISGFSNNAVYIAASQAAQDATRRFITELRDAVGHTTFDSLVSNYGGSNPACLQVPPPQPPCSQMYSACFPQVFNEEIITSTDPNDKTGAYGVGLLHYITGLEPLRYYLYFENISSARASAQDVIINDPLNKARVDLSTLVLGPLFFAGKLVTPPPKPLVLGAFTSDVDLRPAQNLIARVSASLNASSGVLTWHFESIDPATGKPTTDPVAGFLPIGGEGGVTFTVQLAPDLQTLTAVPNTATVIFDGKPLDTPTWSNTLDNTPPVSKVSPLSVLQMATSFPVSWSGTDVGSGIRDYTVGVSDNGGPFVNWLTSTTLTTALYHGAAGHIYRFYVHSRDLTGNIEAAKIAAEATTKVAASPTCAANVSDQITVTRGGFRYSNATQQFVQTVTLTNAGLDSLSGPLSLALDGLSKNAKLEGGIGITACSEPPGSPYLNATLGTTGALASGQSIILTLNFLNSTSAGITYTPRVLSGSQGR